jgi:hypothetical protein
VAFVSLDRELSSSFSKQMERTRTSTRPTKKPGYRMGLTMQEMEKTLKSIERSTAEVHKEDHHAYHPQND